MRKIVDITLTKLADNDDSIRLVVADLGSFKNFRREHPDKFINVGVAESNAIGIASGLSSQGKRVFVYGVGGFILYRAFEQIKFSIGYWKQPICIIGTGFGWKYHFIGRGHFTPDDIALMRLIPNMEIFTPIDNVDLIEPLTEKTSVPRYIRLSEISLYNENSIKYIYDKSSKIIVVSYGEMVKLCRIAVKNLIKKSINVELVELTDLRENTIKSLTQLNNKQVIVIEDHLYIGGLGSILKENNVKIIAHLHLPIITEEVRETINDLLRYYRMDIKSIEKEITKIAKKY